jgi:hypothetical protein
MQIQSQVLHASKAFVAALPRSVKNSIQYAKILANIAEGHVIKAVGHFILRL